MAKLKPIGSEKLEGMEKISRIMEIARYKEHLSEPINEDRSVEYSIILSDSKKYQIVKEKSGYVLKKSLNESFNQFDYLEPMKNRKYYSSYSEAFKRLNLIAKEVNTLTGYNKNISLFTESDNDAQKYVLKMKEQAPTPEEVPAPTTPAAVPAPPSDVAPAPAAAPEPPTDMEMPEPPTDMEMPEPPTDMEMPETPDEKTEEVTFKSIQKLTGKLGQKIRQFLSNEDNELSSKDIKYVVNSVLSALNLNDLEDEDKEEIISKFEGEEETPDMEMPDEETPDMEMPDEEVPAPEPTSTEEMTEEMDFENEEDLDYPKRQPRHRRIHHQDMTDDEAFAVEDMIEGMFTESKVDKILKKYFKIDEKEKFLMEEKKKRILEETKRKDKTKNRIKNLSESIAQEVSSKKLFSKYPTAKFLGKSQENNLIFEINNKRVRVTPKGSVK